MAYDGILNPETNFAKRNLRKSRGETRQQTSTQSCHIGTSRYSTRNSEAMDFPFSTNFPGALCCDDTYLDRESAMPEANKVSSRSKAIRQSPAFSHAVMALL